MDRAAIEQAVKAYRELTPESVDTFRALSEDEVVALKVCLAVTEPTKMGRPRKRAKAASEKG